jgi:flavodoxin
MKIGCIVYSQSGNTLSVAESIINRLKQKGYTVTLERVRPVDEDPKDLRPVELAFNPDVSNFDGLILAAPVQAFSLSPVMKAWLQEKPAIQGKPVVCFVTEHFPHPWMGGTRAMKQFTQACLSLGAKLVETGIVNWTSKKRSEQIEDLSNRITRIFTE